MVIQIILKSRIKEQLSTYQTSYSNFLLKTSRFRPWTCAHPLIPGRTSWRRACSFEYKGRYLTNNGLGPIRAMSPFNTFISCGNSSMEVERTKLPTFVSRCSSGSSSPFSPRSSVMVLNFITLNILASLPGRSCRKNAPAPLFAKCNQMVTTSKIGLMHSSAMRDIQKSKNLLKKFLYIIR